jgi:hypothetical protein
LVESAYDPCRFYSLSANSTVFTPPRSQDKRNKNLSIKADHIDSPYTQGDVAKRLALNIFFAPLLKVKTKVRPCKFLLGFLRDTLSSIPIMRSSQYWKNSKRLSFSLDKISLKI